MIDLDNLESSLQVELKQLDTGGAEVKIVRFGESGAGIPGLRLDLEWSERLARLTYWVETGECLLEKLDLLNDASVSHRIARASIEDIKHGLIELLAPGVNPWGQ